MLALQRNIRGPGPCFGQCSTSREDRRVRHGIATLHGRGERHVPVMPTRPALIAGRRWIRAVLCVVRVYCIRGALNEALFNVSDASRPASPAGTIQEATLMSAAIDSWLPCQFDRDESSRLASRFRLDELEPTRTSVLSSFKTHRFRAIQFLHAPLVSKWMGFCSDPRTNPNRCSHYPKETGYFWLLVTVLVSDRSNFVIR